MSAKTISTEMENSFNGNYCQNFRAFINEVLQKSHRNFLLSVDKSLKLKIKIPKFKDEKQIFSFYDNFFSPTKISSSKKKSGTLLIIWTLLKYVEINEISIEDLSFAHWNRVASCFPNFSVEKLQMRWFSVQKSLELKEPWSSEEEKALVKIVKEFCQNENENNIKWADVAEKLNKLLPEKKSIRLGKHCRERWLNHLDPNLKKGEWSLQEDIKLLECILEYGRKWAHIARILQFRNENSVKNRFFSLLNKFNQKMKMEYDKDSVLSILSALRHKSGSALPKAKSSTKSPLFKPKKKIKKQEQIINISNKISKKKPAVKKEYKQNNELPAFSLDSQTINNEKSQKSRSEMAMEEEKIDTSMNNSSKLKKKESSQTLFLDNFPQNPAIYQYPMNNFYPAFPLNFYNEGLMNPGFPLYNYHMPIFDAMINENLMNNNSMGFNNFNQNGDIDLKNMSQLISSLSLSDEYLLEGKRILSELNLTPNSLSSLQDRLSYIVPAASRSIDSKFTANSIQSVHFHTSPSKFKRKDKSSKSFVGVPPNKQSIKINDFNKDKNNNDDIHETDRNFDITPSKFRNLGPESPGLLFNMNASLVKKEENSSSQAKSLNNF